MLQSYVRTRAASGAAAGILVLACGSHPRAPGDDDTGGGGQGGGQNGVAGGYIFTEGGGASAGGNAAGGATSGGGQGSGASSGDEGLDAGAYPNVTFPFDPTRATPDACASIRADAAERRRPMDVILSIDNSGSMDSEIEEVQERINEDFYDILEDSEIDYRVILVSRYGKVGATIGDSDDPVHISPPLGGSTCAGTNPDYCDPLTFPAHGKFYHYSADIESLDMWQKLLGGLFLPDELQSSGSNVRQDGDQFFPWTVRAPTGYDEFLREGSFKVFVGISDDTISGSEFSDQAPNEASWSFSTSGDQAAEAQEFDTALRMIAPEHFGPLDGERNYRYYAIVGLSTAGYVALEPGEPVVTEKCEGVDGNTASSAGQPHQELARLTGGLRYSSCRTSNYDPIFTAIAQAVVEAAAVPCEFEVPAPPGGELIDVERMLVTWVHGSESEDISRVDSCTGAGYQLHFSTPDAGTSTQPQRISLCEDSCNAVQADKNSKLSVDFGCLGH